MLANEFGTYPAWFHRTHGTIPMRVRFFYSLTWGLLVIHLHLLTVRVARLAPLLDFPVLHTNPFPPTLDRSRESYWAFRLSLVGFPILARGGTLLADAHQKSGMIQPG